VNILRLIFAILIIKRKSAGNGKLSKNRSNGTVFEQLNCSGSFWFIRKIVINNC
jgi:preprotein translocase subunit SecG